MATGCNKKLFFVITLFAFLTVAVNGQVKDWDDVSKEELKMEVYPSDSSASAVVLFDKAEVDLNRNLEYVMERHVRIKILREEGYNWAEAEITYNDAQDQDVSRIRGHTFVINNNGKVEKHKLDNSSIFEEEISKDYRRIKFTLPALTPGAVVEYKYRKHIGSPYLLPDWEFQKSIPVAWSEYQVKVPDWFFYNKMFVGSHPLHIQDSERYNDRMRFSVKRRSEFLNLKTSYANAYLEINGQINRWVMKDLPAVKKLPYMTSVDDYKSKLWIQLTEIRIPQQHPRYFLKSWADVVEEVQKLSSFGEQLKSDSEYLALVNEITSGLSDSTGKMQAIYSYIIESMVWDGIHSPYTDNDLPEVLTAKKGNSAELNLLLVQLLREAGLEAQPILLSTRDHGKVVEYFAIANQFNHVIAKVDIGGEHFLLDATSDNDSVNILPVQDLNGNGLLVSDENAEWIELKPGIETKSKVTFNVRLNNEGNIDGEVYVSSKGYDAAEESTKLKELSENEYINKIFSNHFKSGAIDSFQVSPKLQETGALDYTLFLENVRPNVIQESGDLLYLNPMMFLREEENPFPQPERTIPVEFPYLFEKEYIANIVVPEGYIIDEVPAPKISSIPGGAVEIRRLTQVTQNRITIMSKLSIKRKTFKPEEYKFLREFYSHAVDFHNEQIVLRSETPSSNNEE